MSQIQVRRGLRSRPKGPAWAREERVSDQVRSGYLFGGRRFVERHPMTRQDNLPVIEQHFLEGPAPIDGLFAPIVSWSE